MICCVRVRVSNKSAPEVVVRVKPISHLAAGFRSAQKSRFPAKRDSRGLNILKRLHVTRRL